MVTKFMLPEATGDIIRVELWMEDDGRPIRLRKIYSSGRREDLYWEDVTEKEEFIKALIRMSGYFNNALRGIRKCQRAMRAEEQSKAKGV